MDARSHQESVYRAEAAALGAWGRRWADVRGARAYVEEVVTSPYWLERYPRVADVEVQRLRSKAWAGVACRATGLIRLKELDERVALHELAHLAAPESGHGPEFVGVFCDLVRERMGFMAYIDLLAALRVEGVL